MSCDRYGVDTEGGKCGNGVCVAGSCICTEGWSSEVDFWPDSHFECDTRGDFVMSMATIILVLHTVLFAVELFCVIKTFITSAKSLVSDRGRMYVHWGVGSVGAIIYSCGLISGGVVGTSAACSVGFAVMWAEMFCGWTAFNSQVINFLKKSSTIFTPGGRESFIKDVAPFQLYMPYFEMLALPIPAIIVLVYNLAPDSAGKALIAFNIYVSVFMAVDAYVCAITCGSFCSNIKTLFGLEDKNATEIESQTSSTITSTSTTVITSKSTTAQSSLKALHFYVGIVKLFAMAFGLVATPMFIVFGSSPFMRHKVMRSHLICISCAAFPQLMVLVIFMPRKKELSLVTTDTRSKTSSSVDLSTTTKKVFVSTDTAEDLTVAT